MREAFWNVYCPGCREHYVLHCYRSDPAFVPELDFVMELEGKLIGQVIYARSEIESDNILVANQQLLHKIFNVGLIF